MSINSDINGYHLLLSKVYYHSGLGNTILCVKFFLLQKPWVLEICECICLCDGLCETLAIRFLLYCTMFFLSMLVNGLTFYLRISVTLISPGSKAHLLIKQSCYQVNHRRKFYCHLSVRPVTITQARAVSRLGRDNKINNWRLRFFIQ